MRRYGSLFDRSTPPITAFQSLYQSDIAFISFLSGKEGKNFMHVILLSGEFRRYFCRNRISYFLRKQKLQNEYTYACETNFIYQKVTHISCKLQNNNTYGIR